MHITVIRETEGFTVLVNGESRHVSTLNVSEDFSAAQWEGVLNGEGAVEVEYTNPQEHGNEIDKDSAWIQSVYTAWENAEPKVVYSTADAAALVLTKSDAVPNGYTDKEPGVPNPEWDGAKWVEGPPVSVNRAQGKAALAGAGLLSAVRAAIEQEPEGSLLRIGFEDSNTWRYDSPFIDGMVDALGLTEQQKRQLFIEAGKVAL